MSSPIDGVSPHSDSLKLYWGTRRSSLRISLLDFQGLIVIFMLLIALGIPRRLFADTPSSG
jgi:hypothetical protein